MCYTLYRKKEIKKSIRGTKMIITITIILTGLVGAIGSNYTKKQDPNKVIKWMEQDNDKSGIDVFEI